MTNPSGVLPDNDGTEFDPVNPATTPRYPRITPEDIDEQIERVTEVWKLEGVQTTAGSKTIPTATVTLTKEGESVTDAATGDGPVDAVYEAIQRITGIPLRLRDYALRAITSGKDAQGEVTIEVEFEQRRFRARGVSTDIVEASALAYLAATNRAATLSANGGQKPTQRLW